MKEVRILLEFLLGSRQSNHSSKES